MMTSEEWNDKPTLHHQTTIDTSTEVVERLLEGVTPGPWGVDEGDRYCDVVTDYGVADADFVICEPARPNARFIAAARDLVPALLKERDALRAKVEALEESLEWYVSDDYTNTGDEPMPIAGTGRGARSTHIGSRVSGKQKPSSLKSRDQTMNDAEIAALLGRLDRLHDMLVDEGYYTKANSAYLAKEAIASLHEQLVEARALVAAAISRAEYHADRNTTAMDVFRDSSAIEGDKA